MRERKYTCKKFITNPTSKITHWLRAILGFRISWYEIRQPNFMALHRRVEFKFIFASKSTMDFCNLPSFNHSLPIGSKHSHVHHYEIFFLFDTIILFNHYIRYFETFSCLKSISEPQQRVLMFGSSYLNHLELSYWLGSWYEHPFQSIWILQHSPISTWFYPCS